MYFYFFASFSPSFTPFLSITFFRCFASAFLRDSVRCLWHFAELIRFFSIQNIMCSILAAVATVALEVPRFCNALVKLGQDGRAFCMYHACKCGLCENPSHSLVACMGYPSMVHYSCRVSH